MSGPLLHSNPWSAFAGLKGVSLEPGTSVTTNITGIPRIEARQGDLVLWEGRQLPLASRETNQIPVELLDIPIKSTSGAEHVYDVRLASGSVSIRIDGLPARSADDDRSDDPREEWLHWQVQRYMELGHLPIELETSTAEGGTSAGVVRRTWKSVDRIWKESGSGEPLFSLIVKLSRDQPLADALRQVARSPRKQLVRVREPQRIDRIQELDAACLQLYSRAPGRTTVEKAAARQTLTAVVRRENVDLLENRIARWVLISIVDMARSFLARHKDMKQSLRYRDVATMRALAKALLTSASFEEVSNLHHHPKSPSYCLQSETRYRKIWAAYQAIRREKRVVDDAWRWQLRQWASTSRILLSCLLRGLPGWKEERASTPYFREEGIEGAWVAGPSVPGPFRSGLGECHVLDSRDYEAWEAAGWLNLPPRVEKTGCDWLLVWPERRSLLVIWTSMNLGDGRQVVGVNELDRELKNQSGKSGWDWKGLILLAEPETSGIDIYWIDVLEDTFVLRVPAEIHHWWHDLEAGFALVMEAIAADAK